MAILSFKSLIGNKDVSWWDGITRTFTRQTSTGGTLTLNKLGHQVDVLEAFGDGENYTTATIVKAINEIGSTNKVTLVFQPGTWIVSSAITFTANIEVYCPNGAVFTKSGTGTVTFNGPFSAGAYQVFSGFGAGDVTGLIEINSKWFGTLNTAITVISTNASSVKLNYAETLSANLTVPSTCALEITGDGSIAKASTYTLTINGPFSAGLYQVFSGFAAGDVTFGVGAVTKIHPEWWGIDGTSDEAEINAAINSVPSTSSNDTFNSRPEIILSGDYNIGSSPVSVAKNYLKIRTTGGALNQTVSGPVLNVGIASGVLYNDIDVNIVLTVNDADTKGVNVGLVRWSNIKANIKYNNASATATLNTALYIAVDASTGTYDNVFDINVWKCGWIIKAVTSDASAIPLQGNTFNVRSYICTNGLYLVGAKRNTFNFTTLELWNTAGTYFYLHENAYSTPVAVASNSFNINYIETHNTTANWWANVTIFDASASTINNTFNITGNGGGPFGMGGFLAPRGNTVIHTDSGFIDSPLITSFDFPQSKNYITTPCTFGTAYLSTITNDTTASPLGHTTAATITQTGAGGAARFVIIPATTEIENNQWTFSVWLKADQWQSGQLTITAYTNTLASSHSFSSTISLSTNWKRYTVSGIFNALADYDRIYVYIYPGYNAAGFVQTAYSWGAQLQKGGLTDYDTYGISPDIGDANVTLYAGAKRSIIQYATELTGNKTVTLSATGARPGDSWRIVRTGLGAFTLDVGGLKTIPSATAAFVDVIYDGSAFKLTGYGAL